MLRIKFKTLSNIKKIKEFDKNSTNLYFVYFYLNLTYLKIRIWQLFRHHVLEFNELVIDEVYRL